MFRTEMGNEPNEEVLGGGLNFVVFDWVRLGLVGFRSIWLVSPIRTIGSDPVDLDSADLDSARDATCLSDRFNR
jgi:hypothetical protein